MTTTRWTRRSVAAKALGLTVLVAPLVTAAVVCLELGRLWAEHRWPGGLAVRVLALGAAGAVVGLATAALARRLLPLVLLLHLTLSFPDRAPSRISVALRANRAHRLQRMVERGEPLPASTPQEVATTLLALIGWMTIHDRRTRGHGERVCAIAALLADELGLPEEDRDQLAWAALLHDIGKLAVPAAVLNKKGSLDPAERQLVESHTVVGHELVAKIADWLGAYHLVPLEHHERIDGTGYPHGKAGAEISWGARIVAVADVLDVMTSARSYQIARSWDDARAELVRHQSRQFDPVVVAAALRCSMSRHRVANLASGATGGGVAAFVRSVPSAVLSMPAGVVVVGAAGAVGAATITIPAPAAPPPAETELAAPAAPAARNTPPAPRSPGADIATTVATSSQANAAGDVGPGPSQAADAPAPADPPPAADAVPPSSAAAATSRPDPTDLAPATVGPSVTSGALPPVSSAPTTAAAETSTSGSPTTVAVPTTMASAPPAPPPAATTTTAAPLVIVTLPELPVLGSLPPLTVTLPPLVDQLTTLPLVTALPIPVVVTAVNAVVAAVDPIVAGAGATAVTAVQGVEETASTLLAGVGQLLSQRGPTVTTAVASVTDALSSAASLAETSVGNVATTASTSPRLGVLGLLTTTTTAPS